MSRLSDFHGIGPLADRPSAAAAHALRGDNLSLAITWTDSETALIYSLNLAGNEWVVVNGGGSGYVPDFLALGDTPDSYGGAAGKAVVVNADGNGIDFEDLPTDVFAAWRAIPGNGSKSASEFLAAVLQTGATNFLSLTDTPGSYDGNAGKALLVNAAGTGIDYAPFPSGGFDGGTVTFSAPTPVDDSYSEILLDIPSAALGTMLNSIGGNDAVNLRLIQNGGQTTNGPTGHANYYNTVFALGFNITNSYTPLNTAMPSGSYRIESKFAQGQPTDPFMSEYHMASHFPVDWATPGVGEFRAVTATVPHNSADYNSIHCAVGQRGAMHIVWDWAGRQRILYDFTTAGGGVVDYQDGGSGQGHPKLRFNTNNKPALEQINAAGTSMLPLPFIESSDGLRISQSVRITGDAAANASYGGTPTILGAFITGGMNDGAYLSAITASQQITGTVNGQYLQANATVKLESEARNFRSGGKTGQKLTAAGGDTYYELRDATNDRSFTFNHIASTGKLQLNDAVQGGQFASKFAIEVDYAKFQVAFGYAPKLPSSTVGSLPAAVTAGAGSLQYVTGLNATTAGSVAAGGGSNKGVVVSDGTDWRIMAAWP